MCGRVYETAFASDTDGSQRVVAGDHAADEVRGSQGLDGRCRSRLELVLEYDQTQELQSGLRLFSEHI